MSPAGFSALKVWREEIALILLKSKYPPGGIIPLPSLWNEKYPDWEPVILYLFTLPPALPVISYISILPVNSKFWVVKGIFVIA